MSCNLLAGHVLKDGRLKAACGALLDKLTRMSMHRFHCHCVAAGQTCADLEQECNGNKPCCGPLQCVIPTGTSSGTCKPCAGAVCPIANDGEVCCDKDFTTCIPTSTSGVRECCPNERVCDTRCCASDQVCGPNSAGSLECGPCPDGQTCPVRSPDGSFITRCCPVDTICENGACKPRCPPPRLCPDG